MTFFDQVVISAILRSRVLLARYLLELLFSSVDFLYYYFFFSFFSQFLVFLIFCSLSVIVLSLLFHRCNRRSIRKKRSVESGTPINN